MWTNREKNMCFFFFFLKNRENKSFKREKKNDVAQWERSNNNCYTSTFRYIQIIDFCINLLFKFLVYKISSCKDVANTSLTPHWDSMHQQSQTEVI